MRPRSSARAATATCPPLAMPSRVLRSAGSLPGDELRFSTERRVGQLDFNDFVSSANLLNNNVQAGTAIWSPDRITRLSQPGSAGVSGIAAR